MLDTVSNYENTFSGDGSTTIFSTDFVVFREEDVAVYVDDVSYGYGFTISGIGDFAGFTVTLPIAPPAGTEIKIKLELEPVRDTDYQLNGDIAADELNRDLDRIWQSQQIISRDVDEAKQDAQDSAAAAAASATTASSAATSASSAATSAADAEAAAELLSVLQSGTPSNVAMVAGDTVQAALWKSQGQLNAKLEYKYIGTWAGKPAASTLQYGDLIYITDLPEYFGSAWLAVPIVGVYVPQTGNFLVATSYIPSDSDDSGIDQILQSTNIPAAFLFDGLPLDFDILISKSGATDSATIKLRMGTAGDLTDPVIATFSMSASQRKIRLTPSAQITSPTTINCQPELATDNASNNAWLADVTIPDISNALIISLSVQLSGTTDTATVQSFYAIQRGLG